jgi:hypothetical protein
MVTTISSYLSAKQGIFLSSLGLLLFLLVMSGNISGDNFCCG